MHVTIDGQRLKIDSFYFTETYGGMLEGLPTRASNERVIAEAPKKVLKLWGSGRKTHVIRPAATPITGVSADILERYPQAEKLPALQCYAWLSSHQPISGDACGSHAFVVWWADDLEPVSIQGRVVAAMVGQKWESIAEDYDV